MKFETLELVHELLEKHVQKTEYRNYESEAAVKAAWKRLEELEAGPCEAGQAEIEEAKQAVEKARGKRNRAYRKYWAAKNAMDDFNEMRWG